MLRGAGTSRANNGIETGLRPGLEEQGDDHNAHRLSGPAPGFRLRHPALADARVSDGLQLAALGVVGKNEGGDVAGSWNRSAAEGGATRRSATSSTTLHRYAGPAMLRDPNGAIEAMGIARGVRIDKCFAGAVQHKGAQPRPRHHVVGSFN